mmetsp:Transcript_19220/g.19960  ORF Transcript_19220/g.19960 Transcript_19220/m.19960 type:complete len:153 (-) Transcript_19220:83-541(-)
MIGTEVEIIEMKERKEKGERTITVKETIEKRENIEEPRNMTEPSMILRKTTLNINSLMLGITIQENMKNPKRKEETKEKGQYIKGIEAEVTIEKKQRKLNLKPKFKVAVDKLLLFLSNLKKNLRKNKKEKEQNLQTQTNQFSRLLLKAVKAV